MPLIAATSGTYDLALVLGNMLLIIVAARVGAELAERLRVPAVLGEIVAGILIGPSVLGWVDPLRFTSVADMILLLGEIGVILLLLQVGLEMDLAELGKVGRTAASVAVIGVALPMGAGIVVASAFGEAGKIALFIGAALTATSVGITARVLGDLRALSTTEARVVLGAAVADDVLGLVILTVVVKIVTEGSISAGVVGETIGLAVGFLLVTGLLAIFVIPRALDRLHAASRSSNTVVVAAFGLTIALSLLANQAKLAFIIGAFMAGLGIGRSEQHERIAEGLHPLGHVFVPIFFASIGINADLEAMVKPDVLALAGCLTAVAIVGKLASSLGVRGGRADRLLIGIGMIPRGEVGLIFASIGLTRGILNDDLYGALLLMVLVTTIITPPLLTLRLRATVADIVADTVPTPAVHEPAGGWIRIVDGRLVVADQAPDSLIVPLALRTAELSTVATPGDELLEWFAARRSRPLAWRSVDTEQLLNVLRDGNNNSWRTLATLGVLERALPEIARAVDRRRADPDLFDSAQPLHFPLVDRVHEHMSSPGIDPIFDRLFERIDHPELLTLAAFVHDVADDTQSERDLARRLRDSDANRVVRTLNLAKALHIAARGPDITVDEAIAAVDDPQVLLMALVVALLTSTSVIRAALDEAAHELLI
jgi:Kef-type K+ transport system membrane component KefB